MTWSLEDRIQTLLESNNALLERARNAEAALQAEVLTRKAVEAQRDAALKTLEGDDNV